MAADFGCGHSHRVTWAPAPACTTSAQYEAGLVRKYVCVDCVVCGVNCTARTPCVEDSEAIQPTVQQVRAQEWYEQERY